MILKPDIATTESIVGQHEGSTSVYERSTSTYTNNSKRFLIHDRTFERQYASLYNARLQISTRILHDQARKKWGPAIPIKRLCDVNGSEDVIVIGTIFKHMELHPSILKEISEEHHLIPQPVTEEFTEDDDYLILEDDLQRVVLCGNIDPHTHVTGINVAVHGYTEEGGKFNVKDMCYTSLSEPFGAPSLQEDRYVMLVSGFGLGDPNVLFPLQLLVDYTAGYLGQEQDQEKVSRIVRIVIAGNSLGESPKDFSGKAKFLTRKTKATTVEGVKALDDLLSQLAASVEVDLMAGEFDPTNHLLPQQPLHPCMFPKSSKYSTFHSVTNPYDATIAGVRFLGSSGQNIKDISSFSRISEPLSIMGKTLDWGHMSPTAPDTLNCYPFFEEDPFIISECPHVYFAGNMKKMESRQYALKQQSVLMVTVPKFQETNTAVLINLRTLELEPIVIPGIIN